MTKQAKRVAIYLRVSTTDQSTANQRREHEPDSGSPTYPTRKLCEITDCGKLAAVLGCAAQDRTV